MTSIGDIMDRIGDVTRPVVVCGQPRGFWCGWPAYVSVAHQMGLGRIVA